jgi:serine/threonine protein kinase
VALDDAYLLINMASSSKQGVASSDPQRRLDSKDLPVLRRIGRGLSGFVYETTWSGNRYTRKDFPLGSVKHKTYAFEKEVKPLFSLDHPNIVKCIGYTVGRSCCSLLQEYVNDNLQNVIRRRIEAQRTRALHSRALDVDEMQRLLTRKVKERGTTGDLEGSSTAPPKHIYGSPLGLREVKEIMSAIAFGMKYLHDRGVVHGDLKPKNVFLDLAPINRWNVKVTDFGLVETKKRIKLDSKRSRHLETLAWKAPERLEELLGPPTEDSDDPFTDSDTDFDESEEIDGSTEFLKSRLAMADVYSFGVTCAHMLGGKLLFPELKLTQLREQRSSRDGFKPELPFDCPPALRNLIYSCMQFEPSSRPTFSEIRVALYCPTSTEGAIPGPHAFTFRHMHISQSSLSSFFCPLLLDN